MERGYCNGVGYESDVMVGGAILDETDFQICRFKGVLTDVLSE